MKKAFVSSVNPPEELRKLVEDYLDIIEEDVEHIAIEDLKAFVLQAVIHSSKMSQDPNESEHMRNQAINWAEENVAMLKLLHEMSTTLHEH